MPTKQEVEEADRVFALIPVQQIVVKSNKHKVLQAFFDSGSNIHLVRRAFAEEASWPATPIQGTIITTGGQSTDRDTKLYAVPLIKSDGTEVRLLATALDQITHPLDRIDVRAAAK